MPISAVDLFCGAGGLTHGLRRAGIDVTTGYDLDESCRFAFESNNKPAKFYAVDVAALTPEIVNEGFRAGNLRLLAGCAPCQPFSTYSLGKTSTDDAKWSLLAQFGRLVSEVKPDLVTMENVPKLRQHSVFSRFRHTLTRLGYHVWDDVVDCVDYGIPQTRRRLVLLASRLGEIQLRPRDPRRDKRRQVQHVIGRLEKIEAGGVSSRDPLHTASSLTPVNLRRLKASHPGGTWKDWDEDLVADCHRSESGSTFVGVYGRMLADAPAPTITTQFYGFGNGRFGHPKQDRAISLREGAMLQTFPASYKFVEKGKPVLFTSVGRMIGNAVPVRLGQVIGESLIAHVAQFE
jgi:DNA (cytosine-5)-methyltransferase 1